MPKYQVTIKQALRIKVTVEADSYKAADDKASKMELDAYQPDAEVVWEEIEDIGLLPEPVATTS